ncbi:putative peptidase S9, prolyl oligopeptidase, catalytic domain, dipeptidylpeptidase IV [Septoria linicola]|nr:putative peptidase S9, prolyl oligopeptidase, catalytic domain, dipeptidylpeptidase IV [Septoria linicola]
MLFLFSFLLWSLTCGSSLVWCLRLNTNTTEIFTTFPKLSIKACNLYTIDAAGVETALSASATNETCFRDGYIHKSPEDKYAAAYQIGTFGQNRTLTLVESSRRHQTQPRVIQYQYDNPGDNISILHPRLYDLVEKKQININNDFIGNIDSIEDVQWGFRNHTYRYMIADRGVQGLRMVEVDTSGNSRVLVEERIEKGIDLYDKIAWGFLNETEQMWWLITTGEFDVYDVIRVDEKAQVLYFRALGMVKEQSPYHMHLARINFDGSGFEILTDGDGYHRNTFRSDNTFEDIWSRVDLPLQGVLRDINGRQIQKIEVDNQVWDNITLPERFSAPGRDGETPIWDIIVRPKTFDPAKRYRVMERVYAGPQNCYAPQDLTNATMWNLALAFQKVADDNDVIVVQSDGMGTSWRGRAYRDVAWHNLQEAGFPDRIAWIKAAAKDRPYMDLEGGVGIYGTSAGGQTAMAALIWYSDFYTAATADAGCHDNRVDKMWWNELNVGYPVDNTLYDAASNLVHAQEVNGSLLLLVAELDDNVDPASTLQVINALNAAEKDFDFMLVPGAGHGVQFSPDVQVQNKVKRFWKTWKNGNGLG